MPDGFLTLVILCAVALIVLRIIRASAKLMITAVALAAILWFLIYVLPDMAAVVGGGILV